MHDLFSSLELTTHPVPLGASAVAPGMAPEQAYAGQTSIGHRKDFGQFFTPPNVAALMADWVTAKGARLVFDPALGTGALARAIAERNPHAKIEAWEIDEEILKFTQVPAHTVVYKHDFLQAPLSKRCDGLIMNPPYIRHRELTGLDGIRAGIGQSAGVNIPKSANLYVYFAIKACLHLEKGGRAAILIPSEWMNANFSKSFKKFLLRSAGLKEVVLFSSCSTIFDDALTTASILLIERP